jgi:tellurite resistance protein TerC
VSAAISHDFLFAHWLGTPAWMWLAFLTIVAVLLVLDLGVFNRDNHEIGMRESLVMSLFYIGLGLAFGAGVWGMLGAEPGMNYFTGFALEKALALDNIFVIALIFAYFAIPPHYQHRVLFWGIVGVIVLRALMIGFGAAVISEFHWVLYLFAAFLIATGVKMLIFADHKPDVAGNPLLAFLRRRFHVTDTLHGDRFFARLPVGGTGRMALHMTPLFVALVMIEIADIIFAVDSVPAIFAVTTDPFIVYTSNIFAILGLRALYFALAAMVERFGYLKYALALVLIFIGGKIFAADVFGLAKLPPAVSLSVTFGLLLGGVVASLVMTRRTDAAKALEKMG